MISSLISSKEKKRLKTQALLRKMNARFPPEIPKNEVQTEQEEIPAPLSMKVQNIPPSKTSESKTSDKQSINSLNCMSTKNTHFTTLSDENTFAPLSFHSKTKSLKSPSKPQTLNTNKTYSSHHKSNLTDITCELSNTLENCSNRNELFNTIKSKIFKPIKQEYRNRTENNNEIQTSVTKLNNNITTLQEQLKESERASKKYSTRSKIMSIDLDKTILENKYLESEIEKTQQQIRNFRELINASQKEKIFNENDYENELNDLDELKSNVKKIKVSIDEINADIKNMKSAKLLINKKIDEIKIKMRQKGKVNQLSKQLSGIVKTVLKN